MLGCLLGPIHADSEPWDEVETCDVVTVLRPCVRVGARRVLRCPGRDREVKDAVYPLNLAGLLLELVVGGQAAQERLAVMWACGEGHPEHHPRLQHRLNDEL